MFDEFENMVASIMSVTKCDRAKAEATAHLNGYSPSVTVDDQRNESIWEKEEQREVTRAFIAFGFNVRNLSQARRSKQAPGLPDLWCVHRELPIAFWWETKRQVGGEHSEAQIEFRQDCERCSVGYGAGDRHAARAHLVTLGLAAVDGDSLEPVRSRQPRGRNGTSQL